MEKYSEFKKMRLMNVTAFHKNNEFCFMFNNGKILNDLTYFQKERRIEERVVGEKDRLMFVLLGIEANATFSNL